MKAVLILLLMCTKLFSAQLIKRESLLSADSDQLFNPQRYGKIILEKETVQEALKNHLPSTPQSDIQIIMSRIEFQQISPTRFKGEFNFTIFPADGNTEGIFVPILPKSWILQSVTGFTPRFSPRFPNHLIYQRELTQSDSFDKQISFIFDVFDSATIQLPLLPRLGISFTALENDFVIQYPGKTLQHKLEKNNIYLLSNTEYITIRPQVPSPVNPEVPKPETIEKEPEPEKELSTIAAEGVYTPTIQISFSQGQMEVFANYRFNILHDNMRRLAHSLGELEFESLRFQPPIPFQYSSDYFSFPEGISGEQTLILRARINRPQNNSTFTTPDFPGLKTLPGTIYFITRENIRLEEVKSSELQKLVSLPHKPLENLDVPILSQYSFSKPAVIALKTRSLLSQINNRNHVTKTELTTVITDERKIATAISMQVVNPGSNGLSVALPPYSTILGSYVDSKPVRSFQNESGRFTINLPLSEKRPEGLKPMQVEIKYIEPPRKGLSENEPISLVLPEGLPHSLQTFWNIYFPSHLRVKKLHSNLSASANFRTPPHNSLVLQETYKEFLSDLRTAFSTKSLIIIIISLWLGLFYGIFRLCHFFYSCRTGKPLKIIALALFFVAFAFILSTNFYSPPLSRSRQSRDGFAMEKQTTTTDKWINHSDSFGGGYTEEEADFFGSSLSELKEIEHRAPAKELIMESNIQLTTKPRASRRAASDDMVYLKKEMAPAPSSISPKAKRAYKKVEKSDIKPVKVLFPRLPSEVNLSHNNPIEERPEVKITFAPKRNEKHSYLILYCIIIAFIASGMGALYYKRYLTFALICTLGILLQLIFQPSTLSAAFVPYLFFSALLLPLIYLKKLSVLTILLLCLSRPQATPPEQYIDIYRIYDINKKDFVYDDYYLLNKSDWEKIRPKKETNVKTTTAPTINKQQIEISPDFHSNILKINYKLEFSTPLSKEFFLFEIPPEFQITDIFAGNKKGAILRRRDRSREFLQLPPMEKEHNYEIKAELPIQAQSFDEFSTLLPIASGIINRLKNNSDEKETDIPLAVQVGKDFFFAAQGNGLPIIFRKHGSVKKHRSVAPRSQIQNTTQIRQNVDTRFIAKESSLKVTQQIRPQPPYLFFTNQFNVSHKDAFAIILPENASINEFEFIGKKMQQGIDYGIKKEKNIYYLDFPTQTTNINLKIGWYVKEEQLNHYLPFDPTEFSVNSLQVTLNSVGERSLSLQPSAFLEQFRSSAFSSDRNNLRFENIRPTDSAAFMLSVEERKTVSFASVRCSRYYLNVLLLENIAYQEATFYLTNSGSQFLSLTLPDNSSIETAAINNENLIPARESPESKTLLLPLKKYPDAGQIFRISLLIKTKLNHKGNNEKSLAIPVPDTDVEQFFLQLSSDHSNIEPDKTSIDWKSGASNDLMRMPSTPFNTDMSIQPAISITLPTGKYQWHARRNNLPEGLKIEYQEHKMVPEKEKDLEFFLLIEVLLALFFFAAIYRKSDKLKEQNPKVVISLIIVFGLIFFFMERAFVYFYLIMTIAWLLSLKLPIPDNKETTI